MKHLDRECLLETLQARLHAHLENERIGGAQILVTQHGETVCYLSAGYQNILTKEPILPNAIFRLASMTKPVTGIATLIALDKGWFKLDDLVSDYLPEYKDMVVGKLINNHVETDHPSSTPLRIWHLLSHCNGIMAETSIGNQIKENTPREAFQNISTIVDYCAHVPLAFDPESHTAYTGYVSFDAVARIIELKSGMSYHDFLKAYIFEPLELKDMTYTPSCEQWNRMIQMTDRNDCLGMSAVDLGNHTFEGFPLSYTCAGAGLVSTIEDYRIFTQMLLCKGKYKNKQIFGSHLFYELTKPRVPDSTPGRDPISSWGLGVRVVVKDHILPVGSFGWSGAYGTHFWVDPVNEITAIYMRNSRWYDSHGCGNIGLEFEADVMSCLK